MLVGVTLIVAASSFVFLGCPPFVVIHGVLQAIGLVLFAISWVLGVVFRFVARVCAWCVPVIIFVLMLAKTGVEWLICEGIWVYNNFVVGCVLPFLVRVARLVHGVLTGWFFPDLPEI